MSVETQNSTFVIVKPRTGSWLAFAAAWQRVSGVPPQKQLLLRLLCSFLLTTLWYPQFHGGSARESCLILPLFSVLVNFSSLVYFRVGALASGAADFQLDLFIYQVCGGDIAHLVSLGLLICEVSVMCSALSGC